MSSADLAVIVTTYHMPGHLRRSLESIARQQTGRRLEIVVADDGSRDETPQVVADFARAAPYPVRFVTHEHEGFQAARCRNAGVRASSARHLLFVDGDCVLPPSHVETHLSKHRAGLVTSGYCVRLSEKASRGVTLDSVARGDFVWLAAADELRKLARLHRKAWWYNLVGHPTKPALRSTDFSISRADFERVNGFDEAFRGWGCEDDDLGRRLKCAGIRPVSVLDRTRVYHLWHPPVPSKTGEWREGTNVEYLQRKLRLTRCAQGLVRRRARDLTVRLAGDAQDPAALSRLIRAHGWQVECDARQRADLELLVAPGRGAFRGLADCRVFAVLDDRAGTSWSCRRAEIMLSPRGDVGRHDQVRLRLDDSRSLWRALTAPTAQRHKLAAPLASPLAVAAGS
jgi:glycosyltransferase involved in cell wall biosynthesis